jgi:CrcB protein
MKQILLVFVGGGLGSMMRYLVGRWLPYSGKGFPWMTLYANLLGCFIIGVITGYILRNHSDQQTPLVLFASIGFCGGFTTFSSFANENLSFLRSGDFTHLLTYSMVSWVTGILMVYLGILFEKLFH